MTTYIKSGTTTKYVNGWGGARSPHRPVSLFYFRKTKPKPNLSSHRLLPSFSNIHENQEAGNIITHLPYSLQVFPPYLHFLHTNSFGGFDCFDVLYRLVCESTCTAYINAGFCFELGKYKKMRDNLICFHILCNVILEKYEYLSVCLSVTWTAHDLFFCPLEHAGSNTNRM